MTSAPPTHRGQKLPPEPLTAAEVDRLIAATPNRSNSGIRLRAIIGVLYGSGLRIAETLNLYPRDIDTQTNTIRVRHGKGDKSRTVGINPQGSALLDRWLDRRHTLELTARHPVFAAYTIGKLGQPLDQRYVRQALKNLAEKAGETKRVHPHGFRHSLAFDLAQQGVPTHQIQAQFGHQSLAITDRYVNHLMPGDVIEMMRHHTWGGRALASWLLEDGHRQHHSGDRPKPPQPVHQAPHHNEHGEGQQDDVAQLDSLHRSITGL